MRPLFCSLSVEGRELIVVCVDGQGKLYRRDYHSRTTSFSKQKQNNLHTHTLCFVVSTQTSNLFLGGAGAQSIKESPLALGSLLTEAPCRPKRKLMSVVTTGQNPNLPSSKTRVKHPMSCLGKASAQSGLLGKASMGPFSKEHVA